MDSLTDYVLVDQREMRVEQYTRGCEGSWTYRILEQPGDDLKINSARVSISLAQIYDDVDFQAVIRTETPASQATYHPIR